MENRLLLSDEELCKVVGGLAPLGFVVECFRFAEADFDFMLSHPLPEVTASRILLMKYCCNMFIQNPKNNEESACSAVQDLEKHYSLMVAESNPFSDSARKTIDTLKQRIGI